MKRKQVTLDRYGRIIKVVEFHEPTLTMDAILIIAWRFLLITHAVTLLFGMMLGKGIFTGRF